VTAFAGVAVKFLRALLSTARFGAGPLPGRLFKSCKNEEGKQRPIRRAKTTMLALAYAYEQVTKWNTRRPNIKSGVTPAESVPATSIVEVSDLAK